MPPQRAPEPRQQQQEEQASDDAGLGREADELVVGLAFVLDHLSGRV